ncbi:MAG TPA: polysaccharide biosynthesis/export family protein [Flavipsychrobacter sp.]|nr:polysaccharide biosynthesis/export family protein [Flavipsychrobacter sp.]
MLLYGKKIIYTGLPVLALFIMLLTSCYNPKKISYFNYVPDSLYRDPMSLDLHPFTDPTIKPNDILQISVQTIDPQATMMMGTQSAAPATAGGQGGGVSGYMVDKNGEIELPLAGRIKVGGLTTSQARDAIAKKAAQYYKNPVVNVRLGNFTITVLGEVGRPGQLTVPSEKISVLDAIGLAGDLKVTGRRNDILLIREENGKKIFFRYDLNKEDMFHGPYFYLRQHDILYVGPTKNAAAQADVTSQRTFMFVNFGLTIVTLVITLTSRF